MHDSLLNEQTERLQIVVVIQHVREFCYWNTIINYFFFRLFIDSVNVSDMGSRVLGI